MPGSIDDHFVALQADAPGIGVNEPDEQEHPQGRAVGQRVGSA